MRRPVGSRPPSRRGLLRLAASVALAPVTSRVPAFAREGPTVPDRGKRTGRIITVTTVEGDERKWIVALDPETSQWEKITPSGYARLSPDGMTVAFGIGTGVWTCPLKAGAKPIRIGEVGEPGAMKLLNSAMLAWMPEGKGLIATGGRGDFPLLTFETFRWDADGNNRAKLPVPPTDFIQDVSPDGRWLLTARLRGPEFAAELIRMRLDGTGEARLTQPGAFGGRISPDGTKILYTRADTRAENEGLFLIDADGSNRRRVHPTDGWACWSPDGNRIAFTGTSGPPVRIDNAEKAPPVEDESRFYGRIVIMDLQGKDHVVCPTPAGGGAFQPDWR